MAPNFGCIFNYYRPYTKKRTSLSLGAYPAVTLAEARKSRADARELLAKSINPKEYRYDQSRISEKAHNNTLEYVAAQWLEVKKVNISVDHATGSNKPIPMAASRYLADIVRLD